MMVNIAKDPLDPPTNHDFVLSLQRPAIQRSLTRLAQKTALSSRFNAWKRADIVGAQKGMEHSFLTQCFIKAKPANQTATSIGVSDRTQVKQIAACVRECVRACERACVRA